MEAACRFVCLSTAHIMRRNYLNIICLNSYLFCICTQAFTLIQLILSTFTPPGLPLTCIQAVTHLRLCGRERYLKCGCSYIRLTAMSARVHPSRGEKLPEQSSLNTNARTESFASLSWGSDTLSVAQMNIWLPNLCWHWPPANHFYLLSEWSLFKYGTNAVWMIPQKPNV